MSSNDIGIRQAAFEWLNKQTSIYGDILPWSILSNGFEYNNEKVTLLGQTGIWKPRQIELIPLSIRTSESGPYDDGIDDYGVVNYKYRGIDPFHRDNVGLREAMKNSTPLIYFLGIGNGKYHAIWPVYIIADDPKSLTFKAEIINKNMIGLDFQNITISENDTSIARKYTTALVKQRLHQSAFRDKVITAYNERCALCRLNHVELLDASHIIPDNDVMGEPIVNNGISLCKIHHKAYDLNILGITPDFKIEVRDDILREVDGPMLKHGIQEMNNKNIILPSIRKNWPDREKLEIRYMQFKNIV